MEDCGATLPQVSQWQKAFNCAQNSQLESRADKYLKTVVNRCLDLRGDLNASWRHAKLYANSSLSSLQTAKDTLHRGPTKTWKTDPAYLEKRSKIRNLTENSCDSVKLTKAVKAAVRGTYFKDPFRSEPSAALQRFPVVEELRRSPRPFGQRSTEPDIDRTKMVQRRISAVDEMQQFWRAEIHKYQTSRKERISPASVEESSGHLSSRSLPYYEGRLSPDRSRLNPLRLRIEEAMSRIQPSAEVAAIAQKLFAKKHNLRILRKL